MNEKKDNVISFRGTSQFQIGIVICVIIFVYVLFRLLSYLTSESITVYEVKDGTIVTDHNYRALILRQEELIHADMDGYVYYFATSGGRVGVKSLIYAVDETGSIVNDLLASGGGMEKISDSSFQATENAMATFVGEYQDSAFQKTYLFKDRLLDSLNALQVDALMHKHRKEIKKAQSENTYHSYYPPHPGLVSYMVDGMEDVTASDFNPVVFTKGTKESNVKSKTQIDAGDVAYKLITSDDWNMVVPVDRSLMEELGDDRNVKVTFESDGNSAWASVSYLERDEVPYLVLSLDDSMERYVDQRFVNIELMLEEKSGLKIPNSSIVKKTFFTVPKSYFLQGDNTKEMGVLVRKESGRESEFVIPTIYKETKKAYYIDDETVAEGDELISPDSLATYKVGTTTDDLDGVYNVNKGYAVFKQIEPIQRNEDYTIIRTGTSYGLALYDRIVLQGDKVKENEIIYN
ncbi:MAG: hypothetical protein IJ682_10435 [Lachnospiraceae bacterium]|nr:hypothetical protein [Lachnospiraceae bacterium]